MPRLLVSSAWRKSLIKFAIAAIAVGLLGWTVELLWPALTLLLASYMIWHLSNLYRLHRWLRANRRLAPPEGFGIWSEVFDSLYRRQTESRSRKRRLLEIVREFRAATLALPDGIVLLDSEGIIHWFNPAAVELLGFRKTQDQGRQITDLLRSPNVKSWLAGLMDAPEGIVIDAPLRHERKLRLRVFAYAGGQRLLIARDITQMHRVEAMRKDFVANVSHELRTPLTVISGYVEAMAEDEKSEWYPIIRRMEEQAIRMRALVEDLLVLSHLDASQKLEEDVELSAPSMVRDVIQMTEALSDGKHALEHSIDESLWVRGSPKDLRSAFQNLAANAVRYTQEGGTIRITWQLEDGRPVFAVEDNGPGIAAQHISRLTERFYRVANDRSRATGGTGLGLAIVKNVLSLHDGSLKITSELGKGSRFACVLPSARAVQKSSMTDPEAA